MDVRCKIGVGGKHWLCICDSSSRSADTMPSIFRHASTHFQLTALCTVPDGTESGKLVAEKAGRKGYPGSESRLHLYLFVLCICKFDVSNCRLK